MRAVHVNGITFQSESRPRNGKPRQYHHSNSQVEQNFSFFVYTIPCILSVLCYSNILNGDFVHDDVFAIKNNPDVTGDGNLSDIWTHDFWGKPMASAKSHKSYRPLTILFFRLDYFLSQGDPTWFHIANTFLHGCVTCLMGHVCLRVLQTSELCAVLASSLFAVHPIHTEAVSSIVGRADVLAALLFLLSFIAYARCVDIQDSQDTSHVDTDQPPDGYPSFLLASSLVLAVAASLCKETGFTVLGVCVLYDTLKHGRVILRMTTDAPSPRFHSLCKRVVAVIMTVIVFLTFRGYIMNFQVPTFQREDNPASYSESFLTRVLTFHYLVPCNLWLLVCPHIMCYDWQVGSVPLLESWSDVRNGVTLAFYVIAFGIAYSCLHRLYKHLSTDPEDSNPQQQDILTLPMAGVFLCVPFLPASNLFFTVGFVVAERVLYIPSIGFCILVSHCILRLGDSMPRLKGQILTLTVLLILAFAGKTWQRNPIWASRKALFISGIQTMPSNAKVHFNMANYYKDIGQTQQAIQHYRTAIGLYPYHPSYQNNLGTLLANRSESEHHFRQALAVHPKHKGALVNLGNLMILHGNLDEGFGLLNKALQIDPQYIDAILSMGNALMSHQRSEEAEQFIKQAVELQPDLPEAHVHYGALYHHTGRLEHAVTEYQTAFTLNSQNTMAMKNAAISLRKLGRHSEAEVLLKRALSLREDSDSFTQLGFLYTELGQQLDALFAFKEALMLSPNCTTTNLRYIQALVDTNQHSAANQSLTNLLARDSRDLNVLRFAYTHKQQMGLLDEAIPYLEDAIQQAELVGHSSLGKLYHDRADVYRRRSDYDNSLKFYKLSVEHDPTLVQSYINIGTIYHIQAKYSAAEEFYQKALALNPEDELVKENMTKLLNVWRRPGTTDKR